eukprot:2804725-Amphidinium_carterae.1
MLTEANIHCYKCRMVRNVGCALGPLIWISSVVWSASAQSMHADVHEHYENAGKGVVRGSVGRKARKVKEFPTERSFLTMPTRIITY